MHRVWEVNCCYFKLLILSMHFVLGFCLLYIKLESVGHCLWEKQQDDTIHSSINLETACCTSWHSCQRLRYKDFRIFGYHSEDVLIKVKHSNHVLVMLCLHSSSYIASAIAVYIKCLEEVVLPWIERVAAERTYVWQQDFALCHTSKRRTQ